ncbi:GAF domain-containing sensor histidine kinase [Amycolatopsis pithecellobii]|uniref:GAF domain-containing protein n=1 Tax=Amycolatopsis pithecellobii TaxID=664692 RepID=A0A6N7ZCU8_9PSEU|nr:GAF domain-containing protein [Amycolatopsis pithecellobii]MTD59437.1 GAF domain-containing protein [Amycolatopsis pithecellobii]
MTEAGARALLDAVVGVAGQLLLPDVLRHTVDSARELTCARYGVLAEVLPGNRLGKVVEAGDSRPYAGPDELPAGPGTLAVPVHLDGGEYGRLCVTGGDFTDWDREQLETLAAAAGIGIGNADRHERALRRERWRDASHEVTFALLNGQDSTTTLHTIADRARVVADASGGAVALPSDTDPDTLVFEVIASPFPEYKRLLGAIVPKEGTASGVAYTSGKPVVVSQYGGHAAVQQANSGLDIPETIKHLDSAIAVPLIVGTETLGVLLVVRFRDRDPFSEAEVELVRDFAAHAALAIEFARAAEDRRRLVVFEERDRIARDLHDLVIQRLFAIGLGLEGLGRLATKPEVATQLTGFVRDLDRTIRDVRNSIFSLQEPAEPHGGVRSDLLRMAQDSTRLLGFEPRVSFDGPLDAAVTGPVRGDLLATIREALSNVARHAGAGSVSIEVDVDRDGRHLSLTVVDDGVGFPAESVRADGLDAVRRRAERWHGALIVEPRAEGGTKLAWTAVLSG